MLKQKAMILLNMSEWVSEWRKSRDIRPGMVTHTHNLCSAFNPSKVHTHSSEHTHSEHTHSEHTHSEHTHSEHTPGVVGSHLCCGVRGAVGGSVPCSVMVSKVERERCTFTPPTYNPCQPETWTCNLSITSPTLTIRPRLPHNYKYD